MTDNILDDQVPHGPETEWGVDWAAGKTWGKLFAITFAIALVCSGIEISFAIFSKILNAGMMNLGLGDWLGHWLTELLSASSVTVVSTVIFVLIALRVRSLQKLLAVDSAPDTFPLKLFTSIGISAGAVWFCLIFVAGALLLIAGSLIVAGFSIGIARAQLAYLDVSMGAYLGPMFASHYMVPSIWRFMAERRSHDAWAASTQRWSVVGPIVVLWLITAVAVLGLALSKATLIP